MFYEQYKDKYYSQWGEEGVINEILKRLDIDHSDKWFCEFGAWDGKKYSNTYHYIENFSCNAVYIEGDPEKYKDLLETCSGDIVGNIVPINKYVSDDLDEILKTTEIPKDFLLLSVDIDSTDYHVWNALQEYRPIIVIIEIGSGIPPPVEHIYGQEDNIELGIEKNEYTSFQSMLKLGESKGYKFVCHTGNMIFVREDYFDKLNFTYKYPFEQFCRRHVKSKRNKIFLQQAINLYK